MTGGSAAAWLARLIAILFCAAAIDATVATVHGSLSALVAAAAGAFLAVAALAVFWERPWVAAALSLLGVAGGFAASAILLGSAEIPGAITFTGLTPGDAVAAAVAAAIAAAAIAGIVAFRPPVARALIALAALYALVPLVASIGRGGVHGALTAAPFALLRGAYFGIEILLPLAAIVALVVVVASLVRRGGTRAATALVLIIALLAANQAGSYSIADAGLPTFLAFHRPDALAAASAVTAEVSPQATADGLTAVAKTIPPEQADLSSRAKSLTTPDAAFAYVRDNVGFESYSGILRGAETTFNTRAGNAIDRAMLLAYLLDAQQVPVRFVTGHLAAPQAEQLFARIFEPRPSPAPQTASPRLSSATSLRERVLSRANHDEKLISSALGSTLPPVSVTSHDDAIKEITQHAWLQARVNAQWVDLDPSFPDAAIGHAYASVEHTSDNQPPELMQQVTMRVTTETLKDGALSKAVALEATVPAYKLNDRQIYLLHGPFEGFDKMFRARSVLRPMLIVDGVSYSGKGITFPGAAGADPAQSGSVVDSVTSALDSGTHRASASGPVFVAESLEIEVAFPDGRKDVSKRYLIDRGGTAWRRGATLDPAKLKELPRNKDGLLATQMVYNLWFSSGKHNVAAYSQAVLALLAGGPPRPADAEPNAQPTFFENAWPLAMRNLAYFMVSDHAIVPSLNDVPGLRLYADSPRIFVFGVGPEPSGRAGSVYVESDFRRDVLRTIARDSSVQAAAVQHKIRFGALEGALEDQMGALPHSSADGNDVDTSSLAQSGGITVLRPGAHPSARDPETAARIQTALAAGNTLVVPDRVLAGGVSGWWEIAHDTGDVRTVLDDDLGGSAKYMPEYRSGPRGGGGYSPGGKTYDLSRYRAAQPPKKGPGGELGEYSFLASLATFMSSSFFILFAGTAVIAGLGAAAAWAMDNP
jgi:hypothetical protein